MKFLALSMLTSLAVASPITLVAPEANTLEARTLGLLFGGSSTQNDLEKGASSKCPKAIFIFARGTNEIGNIGTSAGPAVARALQSTYGADQVWVQGVGGAYRADLLSNLLPDGTSQAAINEAIRLFKQAETKCPDTPIVTGGYSQGAALIAAAIPKLEPALREKVVGTVLFGYTKNQQSNGMIPEYPADRLKVYCAWGDLLCTGTLTITLAHFTYLDEASGAAPQFLQSKIDS